MGEVSRDAAAQVALLLRDFVREPILHRPGWIHGERPLPDGQVVLKLALGRFASLQMDEPPAAERGSLVEAARAFVREVCLWERATHYQVLCLPRDASSDSIRENYRLLMALLHPDRQEAREGEWPPGCAQRVNEAHDVLSDPDRRDEYDRMVRRPHAFPEFAVDADAFVPPPSGRAWRVTRSVAIVGAVVATLLVLQGWWVEKTPQHVALLERALPINSVTEEGPRFLVPKPSLGLEPMQLLEPPRIPRRLATWVAPADTRVAAPRLGAAQLPSAPISTGLPAATPIAFAQDEKARASATPEAPPPLRLAQATSTVAVAAATSPEVKAIELLVAQLVSSYEQGDADSLMRLFAPGEPGFFKGPRVRDAYAEFFRTTRERRLRVDRLEWKTAPDSAALRGEATLTAQYVDGRGAIERKVPIEIDISLRNGEARMTSLSLFPEAK